jgi:hypothetical protein
LLARLELTIVELLMEPSPCPEIIDQVGNEWQKQTLKLYYDTAIESFTE